MAAHQTNEMTKVSGGNLVASRISIWWPWRICEWHRHFQATTRQHGIWSHHVITEIRLVYFDKMKPRPQDERMTRQENKDPKIKTPTIESRTKVDTKVAGLAPPQRFKRSQRHSRLLCRRRTLQSASTIFLPTLTRQIPPPIWRSPKAPMVHIFWNVDCLWILLCQSIPPDDRLASLHVFFIKFFSGGSVLYCATRPIERGQQPLGPRANPTLPNTTYQYLHYTPAHPYPTLPNTTAQPPQLPNPNQTRRWMCPQFLIGQFSDRTVPRTACVLVPTKKWRVSQPISCAQQWRWHSEARIHPRLLLASNLANWVPTYYPYQSAIAKTPHDTRRGSY